MKGEYSIFYRRQIDKSRIALELPSMDIFVSAYNSSDRVRVVFSEARASKKIWFIQPEYSFAPADLPGDGHEVVAPVGMDEREQVEALLGSIGDIAGKMLCIDVSGFMRRTLLFLVAKLGFLRCSKFFAIYSEPTSYSRVEATDFSTRTSGLVRPVRGMSGSANTNASDHLIVAVGYDHKLISEVSNSKDHSSVYPLFAFPSLGADMYQQSALRSAESGEVALRTEWVTNRVFAPANDPFATAQVLSELVQRIDNAENGTPNIYLSPLSTKAQTLGFAIFWWREARFRGAVTMLMPECIRYACDTSTGFRRMWLFEVELD